MFIERIVIRKQIEVIFFYRSVSPFCIFYIFMNKYINIVNFFFMKRVYLLCCMKGDKNILKQIINQQAVLAIVFKIRGQIFRGHSELQGLYFQIRITAQIFRFNFQCYWNYVRRTAAVAQWVYRQNIRHDPPYPLSHIRPCSCSHSDKGTHVCCSERFYNVLKKK